MVDETAIPRAAQLVLAGQLMAMTALARALVKSGAISEEVLIESLRADLGRLKREGIPARVLNPLQTMIAQIGAKEVRPLLN